jgi:transcription termination factor Rho
VAAQALEQSVLESKDKDQLLAIAKALGLKATARNKKADIIAQILEMTGPEESTPAPSAPPAPASLFTDQQVTQPAAPAAPTPGAAQEPPAEWELETDAGGGTDATVDRPTPVESDRGRDVADRSPETQQPETQQPGTQQPGGGQQQRADEDGEGRNRRRRRRRKGGKGPDGAQGDDREVVDHARDHVRVESRVESDAESDLDAPAAEENVTIEGYLDLRDEGYGFLRVKGFLPSREDAYVPVKLSRQFGLRKGDHISGVSRPAARNEKNPALLEIHSINGADPEASKSRPKFEDLTALFPDSRLLLENSSDPTDMTARIIDLVSPIGKGQRGIIVSPPKAGKTTVMKTIAKAVEKNNPEVKLMVLLIDERPEEVTDMRRTVKGEVISSTFDRPSEEHTYVAEMTIERAKRMVEMGEDVMIILDGITRLSRAYNLAAPASGRILSGGIDAGALYPPKKFFGAARNVEEGGSLTILATALVETNSRMDDAIFEEFKGTGNMELRLDRRLAERRIYPAIDVDASSTRHEELLFDRKQLQMVWKLRRVLSGLAADGNAAPGLELLSDRLKTFRTNAEFLNEIGKTPSM